MRTYQKHVIVLYIDPDDDSNVTLITFYHHNKRDPGVCNKFNDDNNDEFLSNSDSDCNVVASNGNKGREKNQKRTTTVQKESFITFVLNSKGKVFKVYTCGFEGFDLGEACGCYGSENVTITTGPFA